MSPGECYLMQLSAKITHSSLSELVIAIYRRTDTMKKMGLGNLNWTPNPPGESFNENALLHTPSESLFSNTCLCQCTIGRTGWKDAFDCWLDPASSVCKFRLLSKTLRPSSPMMVDPREE